MTSLFLASDPAAAPVIPVSVVTSDTWHEAAGRLSPLAAAFAAAQGFKAEPGKILIVPAQDGSMAGVLFGDDAGTARPDPFLAGRLATGLPAGNYRLEGLTSGRAAAAVLAFALGSYRFTRYRGGSSADTNRPRLQVPDGVDGADCLRIAEAVAFGRDLVNTPANDLGPQDLADAARALAARYGAGFTETVGDDLLAAGFPMVHAVGRASSRPPRLVDITWGDPSHPRITLVGKGVCFDTGGLNIKPDASMLLMKKDMGGAAAALAAARMIMDAGLPVRLRVLVPAVENAISGSAFRPGDVLQSRKGLSVEIGNTDAEGRLILADALALAAEENPDLLVDFATLTGAARVALGPDLPPFYTDDDALAAAITSAALAVNDPVWRMPLWTPYDTMLDSKVADLNHISGGAFAGSVTAALFLRRFVAPVHAWVHFDIFGWTSAEKPGRPAGGEVQAARLVYRLVADRVSASA